MFTINDLKYLNAVHDSYKVADQESGDTSYYGYVKHDGAWYILRSVISGSAISYRYAKGSSGYEAAWTARASQTYDYFSNVFA